jgi:DUF4097 and DUF4098 domain-containing protein YvlB
MRDLERMKGVAAFLGLAVALTFGAGRALGREKYEEKFERTEALAKDGRVYLINVSGDIVIKSSKEDQVRIDALKVSEASSLDKAKENANLVTIEVTKEAGVLRIETKYPERRTFWGGSSIDVSVSYKLSIPEKAAVDVTSVSGDVNLASIGGAAKVNSVSGNVEILGAAGVEVKLVSGDLTLNDIQGDAYLKSVSGNVTATRVKGSLEIGSVSGDVDLKDVSDARTVSAKSVSGNITYVGSILAGGNYELKSHSGDIEMRIPASSAFEFEANTRSGVIDSDFPIEVSGKISPNEVHGTVNKGGARIRLVSFSGNIDLKKY